MTEKRLLGYRLKFEKTRYVEDLARIVDSPTDPVDIDVALRRWLELPHSLQKQVKLIRVTSTKKLIVHGIAESVAFDKSDDGNRKWTQLKVTLWQGHYPFEAGDEVRIVRLRSKEKLA